jgi:RNA polymerase sigma factor (sigma-70 family)
MTLDMSAEQRSNKIANIVQTYGHRLKAFISNRVDSDEDAEDILQDVWYQLSNLTGLDEITSISGWLFSVSRNRITDSFRKNSPDRLEDQSFQNEEGEWEIRELLMADANPDPEAQLFQKAIQNALLKALKELPEKQRSVFIQNEIEDKTLQEIADAEGENLKTIISRKGYAIKHLRSRLNELYNELND